MDNQDRDNELALKLDPDEAQHVRSLHERHVNLLTLTNEGAILSQEISAEACEGFPVTNHKMVLAMLVLKIVEQLRTAVKGILFGHYSSVPVLLRSVLESVSALRLMSYRERLFKIWVLLGYFDHKQLDLDVEIMRRLRRHFTRRARKSYNRLLSDDADLKPVTDLIDEFNAHVHPDLFALFERAGVEVSLEEMLGESIRQAIAISKEDLHGAIELLELKEKHQLRGKVLPPLDEKTKTFGPGLKEENLLNHYSGVAHAAAHHLYDIVEDLFIERASSSIRKEGEVWHSQSLKAFEAGESPEPDADPHIP